MPNQQNQAGRKPGGQIGNKNAAKRERAKPEVMRLYQTDKEIIARLIELGYAKDKSKAVRKALADALTTLTRTQQANGADAGQTARLAEEKPLNKI